MCYERRSLTADEKKTNTVADASKERDRKREEVVGNLLREADNAGQKSTAASAKEYTPAK